MESRAFFTLLLHFTVLLHMIIPETDVTATFFLDHLPLLFS